MLEALVSTRPYGETETKKRGDVIVVKLAGASWGGEEVKIHQLIEIDDPDLEQILLTRQAAGETNPCIAYPYATYGTDELGHTIMTQRSEWAVDLERMDNFYQIVDPTVQAPKIESAEVETLWVQRTA